LQEGNKEERSIGMGTKIWWVNQGGTFEQSRAGGYLWAPIQDARGVESLYRRMMTEVRKGDVIVHCSRGMVSAISRAISEAYPAIRPVEQPPPTEAERRNRDQDAAIKGRRIDIEFYDLIPPIAVDQVAGKIAALKIYEGPLNKNHDPKQSYLHRFSIQGLRILRQASPGSWEVWAEAAIENDRS
jgi:5-methylcytosine-specific restriction protein B